MQDKGTIGIIILAAGASSRLGQPKQQLKYQEQTLLQHAISAAKGVAYATVVVVLGAKHELILPALDKDIQTVYNPDWEQGMSSSLKAGLRALQEYSPDVESVILMLCDQPFVTTDLLEQLIAKKPADEITIVACAYQDTVGTPVLFGKVYLAELLALQGEGGAKKLLYKYSDRVLTIPFAEGGTDIDTPEDYQRLLER
jgi:molybdenum cofactor cytidylyltransferase